MEKKWEEMPAGEKRDSLIQRWLSPAGIKFVNAVAEKAYRERVTRIIAAVELKKPDRVPVFPMLGFFPAYYCGFTPRDVMYDYDKLLTSFKKYMLDFQPDAHGSVTVSPPGKCFDILDYKLYAWPGHGVAPEHSYQFNEGEYMKADEYDALINDPTYFFLSVYFPRIFRTLDAFKMITPPTNILEMYGGFTGMGLVTYGRPEVQAALKALMEAGSEALKWKETVDAYAADMAAQGFPRFYSGGCKAPFDTIGDTLRGTRGIMLDMYRQPDKLLRALEQMTPLMIKMGAAAARASGAPIVFIPLHKGADGFLSGEQFRKFYWPSFKALLLGLIEEGCIPFPWAEGGYNTRLEVIRDMPRGRIIWGFDTTDMAQAKKLLGDVACVAGNMPIALLSVGQPGEIRETAKKLIAQAGKDGGYIMMNGAVIENVPPENVRAMIDATKEYGVY